MEGRQWESEWVGQLCLPQFGRDIKQDRQTASLLLNSLFTVVFFWSRFEFLPFFFVVFRSNSSENAYWKLCKQKWGKCSQFSVVLCCLRLACHWQTVSDVAFCFATSGCSSYINIYEFPPDFPVSCLENWHIERWGLVNVARMMENWGLGVVK